jgi:hypothetical protein
LDRHKKKAQRETYAAVLLQKYKATIGMRVF